MRALRRPKVLPPTLSPQGKGGLQAEEHIKQRLKSPNCKLTFFDHWRQADVMGALLAMQGWVCAYCNCDLGQDDRGVVDHYRPKSCNQGDAHTGYFWLAYDFKNYFLACNECNTSYKKTQFPLLEGAAHVSYAMRDLLDAEPRLLAHPEFDPVEDWFCVDFKSEFLDVKAGESLNGLGAKRAEKTIGMVELNKRLALIQGRKRATNDAVAKYRNGRYSELRRCASRYNPYGLVYREYLRLPAVAKPLPSADEELSWLLEDIDETLALWRSVLAEGRGLPKREENKMKEYQWLLAVLWKDPPAASPAFIEAWLKERNLLDWVREAYEQL